MKFEEALQLMRDGKNARIVGDNCIYYFINRDRLFNVVDIPGNNVDSPVTEVNVIDALDARFIFCDWEIVE